MSTKRNLVLWPVWHHVASFQNAQMVSSFMAVTEQLFASYEEEAYWFILVLH